MPLPTLTLRMARDTGTWPSIDSQPIQRVINAILNIDNDDWSPTPINDILDTQYTEDLMEVV